jgi:two-component system LytT family response regulator
VTGERVRVLVVDDEPLARETLRLLMRRDEAIEVVGECRSGLEAVEAIGRLAPDLVFLDVQMPELDGFQTLARLPVERRPIIVFVTAYDRYALKAFDAHALDYLVKPFTDERFYAALARAKDHVRQRTFGAVGERVLSLLRSQGLSDAGATNAGAAPARAEAALASASRASSAATAAGSSSASDSDADADARARTASRATADAASRAGNDARACGDAGAQLGATGNDDVANTTGDPGSESAAGTGRPATVGRLASTSRSSDRAGTRSTAGSDLIAGSDPTTPVYAAGDTTRESAGARAGAREPATVAGTAPRLLDRIAVKANGRVTLVRVADIDWIEASDDHVRLHVGAASHELRQPLKELAARLDARRFVRIHRSAIVNLDRIQELQPHFHGSYLVILRNGASLPLSRARREELRAALGGLLP